MCGLFGWIAARPPAHGASLARDALDAIRHRGPDGEGCWFGTTRDGAQLCLGHVRLAIIDPGGSEQPFRSHDGRFTLVCNGEVYNYIELREELRALGHRFASDGDTEVVVEAYRRWGTGAFVRLRGMFALALWDSEDDQLVLARDQVGKKPLFLSDADGGIVFGSEIAALLTHPGVDGGIALDRVGEYLARRYIDGPRTFFHGIRKLEPGHFLVHRKGAYEVRRYYAAPFATTPERDVGFAEAVLGFRALLEESVRLRMRSDAPFGLFLSAGLDSSTLLALMSRDSDGPIRTFSVGFAGDGPSELAPARRTARAFGAIHHELLVDARAFADHWPCCVERRGAPVSEASDVAISLLAHEARRSVKMVLTGEGADELLGGYPKYWADAHIARYHRLIPAALHRALVHPVVERLPPRFERFKIASRAAGHAAAEDRARAWFASGDPALAARLAPRHGRAGDPPAPRSAMTDPFRILQSHDYRHWLPDNLLERGDRMMMAGSIEGRMPFMDVELTRFVAGLPRRHLISGRRGKLPLRAVARELLPPELLDRPKIGFLVPIGAWFRAELAPMVRDLLQSGASATRSLVDASLLDRVVGDHLRGTADHTKLIWTLANLELFLRGRRH